MSKRTSLPNHHALVIGGSIAGLLAARVLSEQFERVTVVDRDCLRLDAAPRRGVPQSVQPHVLFTRGYRILEELFPGIGQTLSTSGAIAFDWGQDFCYFQRGAWASTLTTPSGLDSYTCTRPLLESVIRKRVATIPNIQFLAEHRAIGLCHSQARHCITGVKLRQPDGFTAELSAELIVDASGRSTQAPQWLQDSGFTSPPATIVDPGLGYATRRYRIPALSQPNCKILLISQEPPHQKRLGYLAAVENNEWIATLGGYGQDYPPVDEAGFLDYAQSLSNSAFYRAIVQAEALTETIVHRATVNRLYHYEQIELPDGFVAIGDSVCALCPIYGQGMTVSALSALLLKDWLACSRKKQRLPNGTSFQKQLRNSHSFPWSLATGFDSRFSTTKGAISPNWASKLFQGYASRLTLRSCTDAQLHLRFLEMAHMMKPPSILFHPQVIWKALF
jgi:2-polyprenyl-6-methoxyphenol hydroxylase-like FAD-dependent oxidoreductase